MRTCRIPAVIIAAVIGGVGLSACAGSPANPALAASSAATSAAATQAATAVATPTLTPGPSPTPSASPTNLHSAAAEPSATATATKSTHATTSPSPTSAASGTHDFTVPAIPGDDVVSAYGSYTKIGTARVKVTMCAKQTGSAFSVGAIALAYNASGATQNIGATILTGPGNSSCVNTTFILYTTHLKVHAFIGGNNGTIVKTGPVLTLY